MVWDHRVRFSDLLRLLRILRYGCRVESNVRPRDSEKLRLTVPGGKHHGFLATVAHFPIHLATGLLVCSAWWKQERPSPNLFQSYRSHAYRRTLARRELDFCGLGLISWAASGFRKMAGKKVHLSLVAPACPRGHYFRARASLVGAVPIFESRLCIVIL